MAEIEEQIKKKTNIAEIKIMQIKINEN